MRKLHSLIPCVLAVFIACASTPLRADELHMKDGSIIRGKLLKEVPGQSYRIQLKDGSEVVYPADKVESVQFGKSQTEPEAKTQLPMATGVVAPSGGGYSASPGGWDNTGNQLQTENQFFVSLYGAALIPVASDRENLDPFYGGGIAFQTERFRIALEGFSGSGKAETYDGYEYELDSQLIGVAADFLFSPPLVNKKGAYYGIGVGYYKENGETMDGDSIAIEGIVGFRSEVFTLFTKLQGYPQSANTTVGVVIGAGLSF